MDAAELTQQAKQDPQLNEFLTGVAEEAGVLSKKKEWVKGFQNKLSLSMVTN
jgi:hypothetical protein